MGHQALLVFALCLMVWLRPPIQNTPHPSLILQPKHLPQAFPITNIEPLR
jgi:hypothetical protein